MNNDTTFSIIKPDAIENNYQGLIIDKILQAGFKIIAMKLVSLSNTDAKKFYHIHADKVFFSDLVQFMCSGPIIALALQKNNAVSEFRNLIGATDPKKAQKETLRAIFAESIERNAVHGSDSNENAKAEIAFFFSYLEILNT